MRRRFIFVLLVICVLFATISRAGYYTIPVWSKGGIIETSNDVGENFLDLNCESAILISQDNGEVLYDYNSHEQLRPASVTKIMTLLLIMEEIDSGKISYGDKVLCSENASKMGGSQIWLDSSEELTVDEMLKAICVVSANDCTVAMAEFIAGSEEIFVEKMNEKAKELGMNDTVFKNCHGIDEDGHVTSSYDISLMSKELLNNHPDIKKYTTIWMDSLRDGESELVNTNKLIRNYQGATGLKTGSTSLALFNLSASATRDNLSLIAVIMKAPTAKDRFSCAKKLLDYGFANYEYRTLSNKDEFAMETDIAKGDRARLKLNFERDFGLMMKKDESIEIEQEVKINENLCAPVKSGDVVGKVSFKNENGLIGEVNLVSGESVNKISWLNQSRKILRKWFYLFRV